jgi:hypothetical protein
VRIDQKHPYLGEPRFSVLYEDQDSIDLFGQRSDNITVDLATTGDAELWAEKVFAPRALTHVQSLTTPTIDRQRNLTEAIEFMPGDYVGVSYVTSEIDIETTYTITRVRHTIDVNNWFTTLEVWKE